MDEWMKEREWKKTIIYALVKIKLTLFLIVVINFFPAPSLLSSFFLAHFFSSIRCTSSNSLLFLFLHALETNKISMCTKKYENPY